MLIQSKLPHVETTIFTLMSQLATQCNAINLSQGFPDFDTPQPLLELVNQAMREGYNQYAPMTGMPQLRDRIAQKTKLVYQQTVDPVDEITVTSGATEALFCAITAMVKPGDEVIIFDPAYDSYEPVITLSGGKTVRIPLQYPDYHIDWDQVKRAVTEKTTMLIVNSPHNPTGMVLTQADIDHLIAIVERKDIVIVSDEVYEHIVFDGMPHLSMLNYPVLRQRAFVVSSFGKTYHATGWKLGYCIAPPPLSREFRKVHQYNTFTSCTPMQLALAEFLQHQEHYLQLANFYQAKRDYFLNKVSASRFKPLPCKGTYFQMLSYADITQSSDIDYAKQLTQEFGIASIPISVFFGDGRDDRVLRFCFAKDEATLDQAAKILCAI